MDAPYRSDREHKSVTVRKIGNGYLAEHSSDDGEGYKSKTVYHPKKPTFSLEPAAPKKLTKSRMKKLEKVSI